MSKKIIYLLSLLMALSLVFASCKKNSGLDPNNSGFQPDKVPEINNTDDTGSDGLFTDYSKITNDVPIAKKEVTKGNGTDYVRNPVIVNLGKGNLVVFAELRYKRSGAANDVGIDGHGVVDIVYYTSKDSGKNWVTREKYVNLGGVQTTSIDKSHGAPVVFYKAGVSKIVVVATSGTGIGRDSTPVNQRGVSKVDYITGTVQVSSGSEPTITWSDGWKEITGIKDKLAGTKFATAQISPTQYATHSARGVVDADGKLYLPVTIAYQGTINNSYELMGHVLVVGDNIESTKWSVSDNTTVVYHDNGKFTKYKEARATSETKYLVVPSPYYVHTIMGAGKLGEGAADNGVTASAGSAGYLLVPQWFGSSDYTINNQGGGNVTLTGSAQQNTIGILTHVQQPNKNMHMYVVKKDAESKQNSGSYKIVDNGLSSCIDVLEDGTIITAAEEGLAGANLNYYIVFSRYSQKFINDKTGGK